jgi:hypothetical protein
MQYYDFDPPSADYRVHTPSVGIDYAFSPSLTGSAQFGYYWKLADRGNADGFTYQAGLVKRTPKTTYELNFQGGYTEDYFSAENLGFIRYHKVLGAITHQLKERMTVGIKGTVERMETDQNRTDNIWAVIGNIAYKPLKWLTISLEASRRENNSTMSQNGYAENRGLILFTLDF